MKSKRLLTELIEYIALFEQAFPEEEELSLMSFLVFTGSMLQGREALEHLSGSAQPVSLG